MAWEGLPTTDRDLTEALRGFDWRAAERIVEELIERITGEPTPMPEADARRLLGKLRRKRRFHLMTRLADALIEAGQRAPQIRRQYAQSLIDQGILAAARLVLQAVLEDSASSEGERQEARGLIGRIYKQLYVNAASHATPRAREHLLRALSEYLDVYRLEPSRYLWHGINAAALLARAQRDGLAVAGLPDFKELASEILITLEARARSATEAIPAFDVATTLEALVALGRPGEAASKALEYGAADGADAFEIASTLRQLETVWHLDDAKPPGNSILPTLRAALLRREGAVLQVEASRIDEEIASVEALERVLGTTGSRTLAWYRTGLERCGAIARIERLDGRGHGTGWLVRAEEFVPGRPGVLVLTNAHVVGRTRGHDALEPRDAQVHFQVAGRVCPVKEVLWSSPVDELDASLLVLDGDAPDVEPLPLQRGDVAMTEPPPRLYIIGHPGGRDLEISLQDNHLIASRTPYLHYRTPTEGGSSGSPVFEGAGWRVVALHHATRSGVQSLDGPGATYAANEGIAIDAITAAARAETVA
jgi:hypothetical protein